MKLPRRTDFDLDAVLAELDPNLDGARLSELGEGWDNIAYAVHPPSGGQQLLLRVSKFAEDTERFDTTTKDADLLRFVARRSPLVTNTVRAVDPHAGMLLLTMVPGIGAGTAPIRDRPALAESLGTLLARLHRSRVPNGLVDAATPAESWRVSTATAFARVTDRFGDADRCLIESFLTGPAPDRPRHTVFCHNDLGAEHLIVDPESGALSGVIDWSDAVHDDPARDFALVWADLGWEIVEGALAAYVRRGGVVDPGLVARARWFAAHSLAATLADEAARNDPALAGSLVRFRRVLQGGRNNLPRTQ
ncbi:phosphotransferase family protein [Nostocoides jenkinsii]|uniref:Putative Aminoglycoside phosphotransferase n=1 Tax=Nostocoides jenkinsii Ben 74 TaxID=1193518 RepID=A0A077M6B4_9MICO|nr:aminoglycoside phosphotransferase family protein [Tetrasphaera jenkinsii]CCI52841.1 putative Aminoglycoside phosphotransferase [Tetrasphaera jenkinsii Ben 74]